MRIKFLRRIAYWRPQTLRLLRSQTRWNGVTIRILDLGAQRAAEKRSKTFAARTPDSEQAKEPTRPARSIRPRVWPYPDVRKVLDRPFQEISGRRHVPKLVNANKVPILQFKKPQSPFLSRMIRDIIETRQKRVDLQIKLKDQVQWARGEDLWDFLLRKSFGLEPDQPEKSWSYQLQLSHDQVQARHMAAASKQVKIAAKMHAIVEKEKALALEEKLEKHRMKRAERLARPRREQSHSEETDAENEPPIREEGLAEMKSGETVRSIGEEPDGLNWTDGEQAINEVSRPESTERRPMERATRGGRTKQQLQMEIKLAEQESPLAREIIAKMRLKENLGRTGGQVDAIAWTEDEKAEIKAARKQRKEDKAAKTAVKREQMEEQGRYWQKNGKLRAKPFSGKEGLAPSGLHIPNIRRRSSRVNPRFGFRQRLPKSRASSSSTKR